MHDADDATNDSKQLSHLDADGAISMVDVGTKTPSRREAVAVARVRMSAETLQLLRDQALPKGDVLTTAKIAGILAAKQTPMLIPLTHPLPLSYIDVAFTINDANSAIDIHATVRCEGKTGVEIEAMTACSIAALTIYDMCKSAEKGIVIEAIRLLSKSGGKSGQYTAV
jgi:cyclic pyranopterin phosphate synthase